ncbi:restriction endonuclease subunit S [Aliarcobacter butzleri]|uniref:restriction endonuclease subunit S n=1 Tax=Aliarcobacter butzleri TaxID=28197 RepID=UPI00263D7717|nr:restriction endonuclease subunit S [Aliarcobacter butzleri]MDN5095176.1 restriction endonuclease subunit S [Aliarcobacter butzleri]
MNKFPIKEVFKIHGGVSGLTEKVIYENQSKDPEKNIYVYSGATEERFHLPKVNSNLIINEKRIKTFSKKNEYILISRKGKAGYMQLIKDTNFTINDDAYIMQVKKNFIDKVNLDYFIHKYQKDFLNFVSSKDSNGTFSKEIAQNYEIELISIEDQNSFIKEYSKKQRLANKINDSIVDINKQIEKITEINSKTKNFLISELFKVTSGKRIVQREVYNNPGTLPIVSAQTDDSFWYASKEWLSTFNKNGKSLIFNQPCISWVCVGRAGTMFYRDFEFYLTDNAGVLIPKKENINLKWFIATYQEKIRDLRQGDRQGQSTMFTEHISNIEVEIPVKENGEIDLELQNTIYAEYEKLINFKTKLENILQKLSA